MAKHRILLLFLFLAAFSSGLASYMTAGLIPLIAEDFSVSIGVSAQLVSAFTLPYGLISPLLVGLTDRFDPKKNLCAFLLIFTVSNGVGIFAREFTVLILPRVIARASSGAFLAYAIAVSARLSGKNRKGKSISVIMAGMSIGTVVGVPLSLYFANSFGCRFAMAVISIDGAISLIGLFFLVPPLTSNKVQTKHKKFNLALNWPVIRILLISLFTAISSLGMYTFLAPFIMNVESKVSVTIYLWFWGIGGVFRSIIIGYFVDKISYKSNLVIILALLLLSFISLYFLVQISLPFILLPLVVWGSSGWALQVPQNNELLEINRDSTNGNLAVGLNQSSVYLGGSIGAVAGGILLSYAVNPMMLPLFFVPFIILALLLLIS